MEEIQNEKYLLADSIMECEITQNKYWPFNLVKNKEKEIIKEISSIIFEDLKILNLRKNHLESIEGLHRLKAPHLSSLDFCNLFIIKASMKLYQSRI